MTDVEVADFVFARVRGTTLEVHALAVIGVCLSVLEERERLEMDKDFRIVMLKENPNTAVGFLGPSTRMPASGECSPK